MKKYNQFKAFRSVVNGSFKSLFRSPSTLFFGIAFPVVFVFIFGFLSSDPATTFKIGIDDGSDTSNLIYHQLVKEPHIYMIAGKNADKLVALKEGRILVILKIKKSEHDTNSKYTISFTSSNAVNVQNAVTFRDQVLKGIISQINEKLYSPSKTIAKINPEMISVKGTRYKTIDFVLPGQIGFSLMALGILSIAMVIYNLRKNLVFKRLFASPLKPLYLLVGEVVSRLFFQTIAVVIIVGIGMYVFGFSLQNGVVTFLSMLALSMIGLIVFFGFGLLIGTTCNNENAVSSISNFITIPQLMLAGSFFDIDNFPGWLQPICKLLPLSYFNHAMRLVSFNGASLWDCRSDIFFLLIWGVALYGISIKRFRWE